MLCSSDIIISPALIILMDYDLIIIPSYIIYALGLQWAWQFNIIFQPLNLGFDSYCDHYIISMISFKNSFCTMFSNINYFSLLILRYNSNITFHGIFMTSSMIMRYFLILLGFRYLASSIPSISLAGVAIGVGLIMMW